MTRPSERTRPSLGERSQLQYVQRKHPNHEPQSEEDELAAWDDAASASFNATSDVAPVDPSLVDSIADPIAEPVAEPVAARAASPGQTPLVERFDLDAAARESSLRGTGGAAVLDDEQQAAVVRSLLLGELSAEEAQAAHRVTREQLTQWVRKHRRSVRRSIEEQIGSALSQQGLEKEDFVLSGNLESMSLSDLLETIQLGRKNAHVRVESGNEVGELWFADGDVIDARTGNLVGSPAVYRLLELKEGKLQAEFCSTERERTILASTETLLIEYARRADERKMLRDQIGDLQRVYVACVGATLAASLEPRKRELLQAFDGNHTVENVLESSDRQELDTLAIIAELLAQKQIVPLAQPRVSEKPGQPRAVSRVAQPGYASLYPSNAGPATLPSASAPEAAAAGAPPSSQAVPSQVVSSRALSARGGASLTVPPIVPSVALLQTMPALARRSAPFVLGSGALVLAFAVGLWSARSPAPPRAQAEPVAAAPSSESSLTEALCGSGMELFTPKSGSAERPFCLAQRSVSTAEYQACVEGKHCEPTQQDSAPAPGETDDGKARCNAGQPGRDQLPINCVTQRQAEQYCEWRGQRLPLPAEWELAWQASRGARSNMSFAVTGLESPLGELSEWTKERSVGPRGAAPAAAPSSAAAAIAAGGEQPTAGGDTPAAPPSDTVETIEHEPGAPPALAAEGTAAEGTAAKGTAAEAAAPEAATSSFAVLRAPPPGVAQPDARPKRLYTSATAQGRGIGFRCAVSLETTR